MKKSKKQSIQETIIREFKKIIFSNFSEYMPVSDGINNYMTCQMKFDKEEIHIIINFFNDKDSSLNLKEENLDITYQLLSDFINDYFDEFKSFRINFTFLIIVEIYERVVKLSDILNERRIDKLKDLGF
ncbi:MAG: hypothetical protein CFE21_19990 [Bacteroidetes bacterium B1(2017)]|nr:MAG: hypothetical protein CFE21_19990 [Bacteroidetes bacterium B1(2017)]